MAILQIELNEINFDAVRAYGERGHLPVLNELVERHGITQTTSEQRYEELEPWIQWVTAHSGLTLEEHRVFRLGDIVDHDIPQIWEHLEQAGLRVGAVSPMNAKNRTQNAAFFIPDPWTQTRLTGSALHQKVYDAISQAVNDNAQSRLTGQSLAALLQGLIKYGRPANYARYVKLAAGVRSASWNKAMFLDLLLADMFIKANSQASPDFASLFLNAGAHIQHHYMFSSAVYQGELSNPDWLVKPGQDPVLDVYRLYDEILGQIRNLFPDHRLIIATGLHQDPHPALTYYWRLRDHANFLRLIGVPFVSVEPRMSRDFLISCKNEEEAARAASLLESCRAADGEDLFEVDNRGRDLFVMLTYPHEITDGFSFLVGNSQHEGLERHVAFVAIKNGQHNGTGYLVDTGLRKGEAPQKIPLATLPDRICKAFGVGSLLTGDRAAE